MKSLRKSEPAKKRRPYAAPASWPARNCSVKGFCRCGRSQCWGRLAERLDWRLSSMVQKTSAGFRRPYVLHHSAGRRMGQGDRMMIFAAVVKIATPGHATPGQWRAIARALLLASPMAQYGFETS